MVPPIGFVKKILKLRQVSQFHSHLFEFVVITVLFVRISFHLLLHCRRNPLESYTALPQPHLLRFYLTHQPLGLLYQSQTNPVYWKFPSTGALKWKSVSVMKHLKSLPDVRLCAHLSICSLVALLNQPESSVDRSHGS